MIGSLVLTLPSIAMARPVSYQGGWTVFGETDRQMRSLWVHYTPDPKISIGMKSEWDDQNDILFNGFQGTWLAKRWFAPDSQANLYVFGSVGLADGVDSNPGGTRLGGQIGVLADWETRRWFLGYRARAQDFGALDQSVMQAGRIGWAPYEGKTGDLHTWVMLEVDHRPDNDIAVDTTPLLRFFKGPALFEIGYSLEDNEPLINFQYRF